MGPRLSRRPRFRIWWLLALVAAVAAVLGAHLARRRWEARLYEMRFELRRAAMDGDVAGIRRLLAEGADVDGVSEGRSGWTPLHDACFEGRIESVKALLEGGADVNRADKDFYRPINLAASAAHWDVVRLLLEHGADVTASDALGKTALDYAKEQGEAGMVRDLEEKAPRAQ